MAEIQEYTPQVSTAESIGSVNQNIELAGAEGMALENAGNSITEGSLYVQRRAAQRESAQVYAHMMDLNADMQDRIQKGVQDGSLATQGAQDQLLSDYDNQNEKVRDQLTTPQAQNYFDRLQSRFRGHIMHSMSMGAGQVAGAEAQGLYLQGTNSAANAIHNDPSSFQTHIEALQELEDQSIATGMKAKDAAKLRETTAANYATAAVQGWADSGPKGPDMARQALKSGMFDNFLSQKQQESLRSYIDDRENKNQVSRSQELRNIEDAQKIKAIQWGKKAFDPWVSNSLTPDDVANAVRDGHLDAMEGKMWVNMIAERQKQMESDPLTFLGITRRTVDPNHPNPVSSVNDIAPHIGHGLDEKDAKAIHTLIPQNDQEAANQQSENMLIDRAKKAIQFQNNMNQQPDGLGNARAAQFVKDYAAAKDRARANGTTDDLTNPNSKNYFGSNIINYITPPEEQLNHQAQDRTNKALGLPHDADPNSKPKTKNTIRPGESPAAYLKRIGMN
jgi:hypothetical protein